MKKAQIVFATYNGKKRVGKTLSSLIHNTLPQTEWEVIAVDNNSTDGTRQVIESFKDKLPLKIVDCPTPGKSNALNAAFPYFTSDLIIFTDDDIDADPQWIEKMIEAADRNPDYSVFAGAILPDWEKEPSPQFRNWIPIGSTYAVHENIRSGPCAPGKVWGPNMAFRRKIFDQGIMFNPDIGPSPKKFYPMGNDTELANQAIRQGFKSFFVPDAKVTHLIKAETVNEKWVQKRAERLGYGLFRINPDIDYVRILPAFIPLKVEFRLRSLFWTLFYPATFILPECKLRFWSRWKHYYYRGLYKGYLDFISLTAAK